ncbi:tRNA(Ser) Um(44) 2'-O-methyltransferase [Komagataella phaffii CBS 7435]|uniref:tRNA (uracil-O(2)-)-methyltransferase n=2 Tax=Komagataella phaffii TaxID=460519 RepID=C4R3V6_KOMPG|nr:tRNA(Ser) Um(44) 2'-O-methyltransferase [Komagataella phaffii GS115]AOA63284.1 GQ67_03254T0 [Komagataella phaffii]CAH2450018.1 tRNA(Ser) Um(44) 2'-O-methyltransferase [Komagataella phaffii CBS 7435]AOA68976.1 GQ68_03223T0 [Komagataella phaffii GS115]CAY70209.1 tRNA(Ser) Um(44) 2'-O-methyltransferase [Komagataella phaffii GS115]CCA39962.1 tRNA(Ser) Um(44) 2'-O-methyltransferase [Komagataella phaffii CBS 7435]
MENLKPDELPNILPGQSLLGKEWHGLFETKVDFSSKHFKKAMLNLIREPNINSTVILRADILIENDYIDKSFVDKASDHIDLPNMENKENSVLTKNIDDTTVRTIPLSSNLKLVPALEIVRRIIPRNPFKDCIINQTCLLLQDSLNDDAEVTQSLIVYVAHLDDPEDIPFYLPCVKAVALFFDKGSLSVHYLPFDIEEVQKWKPTDRPVRTAYRLLKTCKKHSEGVMSGYEKRVNHDLIVPKEDFQNRYISLKRKYSKNLVDNWKESTDPRKHVFEDLAIAAFLIELWSQKYPSKDSFQFRDLGCGNGLLVYILIMEGYHGMGIDARRRKSWDSYPESIQENLLEQVIIPSVLLRPHPAMIAVNPYLTDNGCIFQVPVPLKHIHDTTSRSLIDSNVPIMAYYSSATLLESPHVNTAEFPPNTFLIGNHSDELTCWMPLLRFPFLVIPCCSHALDGSKARFPPRKVKRNDKVQPTSFQSASSYAGLVDHVEDLATQVGWKVEKEMLRIPSTRNAALIGFDCLNPETDGPFKSIYEILAMEGGAEGWVENAMALSSRSPRGH